MYRVTYKTKGRFCVLNDDLEEWPYRLIAVVQNSLHVRADRGRTPSPARQTRPIPSLQPQKGTESHLEARHKSGDKEKASEGEGFVKRRLTADVVWIRLVELKLNFLDPYPQVLGRQPTNSNHNQGYFSLQKGVVLRCRRGVNTDTTCVYAASAGHFRQAPSYRLKH